jgi:hypothetical protein
MMCLPVYRSGAIIDSKSSDCRHSFRLSETGVFLPIALAVEVYDRPDLILSNADDPWQGRVDDTGLHSSYVGLLLRC